MGTSAETAAFVLEQAASAGDVSVRRMFGEYALYLDGKVVGLICDDVLFLKDTEGTRARIDAPETGSPFPGAKPYLLAGAALDDPEDMAALLRALWDDLPMPKPKSPRKSKRKAP